MAWKEKFEGGLNNSNNRAKDPKPETRGKRFVDDPHASPERLKEIDENVKHHGAGSEAWAKEKGLPPYDKG